ncbi:MAG: LacI family transcriptional regulator [Phycisphaerae bacterium]|nr:LacI family transcriptional regulator [Phycisphaerae bacterium]
MINSEIVIYYLLGHTYVLSRMTCDCPLYAQEIGSGKYCKYGVKSLIQDYCSFDWSIIMAVTQMDIAERVGVDQSLVSVVLSNKPTPIKVSVATRQRILQAVKEMNYRPNLLARALAKGKTHTIGFLTASSFLEITAAMLTKMDDFAEEAGYEVHSVHTRAEFDLTVKRAHKLIGRGVDGLIISGAFPSIPPSQLQAELSFSVPTVLFSLGTPMPFACRQVYQGSSFGVKQAVDHLYELGHRQIYMIGAKWKGWEADLRFAGFNEGIESHSLGGAKEKLYHFPTYRHTNEDGRRVRDDNRIVSATKEFVKNHPDCTAIICVSDDLAMPILDTFTRMGIRVPEDISIVSFGNDPATLYTHPPLSTIDTPVRKLTQATFDLLMDGIDNKNKEPKEVVIPSELILRQSSGPVRKDLRLTICD